MALVQAQKTQQTRRGFEFLRSSREFASARWAEEALLAAEDGELEEPNERDVEIVGERGGIEAIGEEAREDGARQ